MGRGGMGIVYQVEDLELEETVAIKVLFANQDSAGHDLLARFKREINLNRKIKHANVARLYEFGTSGDVPYLTMEFVPGRTVLAWRRQIGRFPVPAAVSVLRQVALGAHAAHKLGIVHRDLKSANVMLAPDGHASILDFGLARGGGPVGDLTGAFLLGTPEYMAPEQALGHATDARTDVYAIGVIAYEILTGSLPFTGKQPVELAMRHVNEPLPDGLQRAGVPAPIVALVASALAKKPSGRPGSAAELAEALRRFPGGDALVPPPGAGSDPDVPAGPEAPTHPRGSRRSSRAGPGVLPAAVSAVLAPASPSPSGPATVAKRRRPAVLVVEPAAGERQRIADALAATGCDAQAVGDGPAALEALRTRPTDLVVLSVTLPGMDGFDVARILKADPKTADVPVLLVTDRLVKAQIAFAQQVGAAELLTRSQAAAGALVFSAWRLLEKRGFTTPDALEAARRKGRAAVEKRSPSGRS